MAGAGVPARLDRAGVGGDLRVEECVEDMTIDAVVGVDDQR